MHHVLLVVGVVVCCGSVTFAQTLRPSPRLQAKESSVPSSGPSATGTSRSATTSLQTAPLAAASSTGLSQLTVGPDVQIGNPFITYFGSAVWRQGNLLAWQNGLDGTIWYCSLNPQTGDMIPWDGRAAYVAKGAPYVGNVALRQMLGMGKLGTYNGPEWGISQEGLGVYFTIPDGNGIYQQARCLLNQGQSLTVDVFTSGGTENRFGNLPTQNPGDSITRVGFFKQPTGGGVSKTPYKTFWQFDQLGDPEYEIPLDTLSYNGPRWIPGEPSLLTFVTAPDETIQVASLNTDTQELTFLTAGPENHADAEIAIDPVSGRKFMTAVENDSSVAVYEFLSGSWQKMRTVVPNLGTVQPGSLSVFAVKPLIVRGELIFYYNVFYAASNGGTAVPINIFVGSGSGAINQQITSATGYSYCINPQWYIGEQDNKVYLYYYTSIPVPILDLFSQFRRISFTVE
jgi:hypothetical protein